MLGTFSLAGLIVFLQSSKYVLLFIGCFVEGTAVMMIGGFLWHIGQTEFLPTFLALFAADILSDTMWYVFGYFGARNAVRKWGHLVNITQATVDKVEKRFQRYHTRVLVISKLSMGLGFAVATLTVAGMLRVPFRRFLAINVICGVVWITAVMFAGYYLGNVYETIPQEYKVAFAVSMLAIVGAAIHLITKYSSRVNW